VQLPWTVSADFAERHRFSQKQAAKLAAVISRHANKNGESHRLAGGSGTSPRALVSFSRPLLVWHGESRMKYTGT
jgi:hypothetical protein